MVKVKLVIWDLDETFWQGTLSEGEVSNPNIALIKKLANHGIINSISSKNDFEQAKRKLIEYGVWDLFVFPSINWNPKGEAVAQIIKDCQLRAANVVFLDDNSSNRNEVVFYNESITTFSTPEEFADLIDWEDYRLDPDLERLKQYKLLEEKKEYRKECSSNIDFLYKSNIKIQFIYDLKDIKNRLVEMISRTNQLNYTKNRIGIDDLELLINNSNIQCAAIKVYDNFGDYGICGFYALDIKLNKLLHFLFSCRILNLGVENYVFNKLNHPLLDIAQPVSTNLDIDNVDWIKEEDITSLVSSKNTTVKRLRIAMIGGCDLDQLCYYFNKDEYEIIKDFNYSGRDYNGIHREHTVFQRLAKSATVDQLNEIKKLPFLDDKSLDFNYQKEDYDFLVFSPLMNYTQELYRNKYNGLVVAYGGYTNVLKQSNNSDFSKAELDYFKNNYELLGQQSPDEFIRDLDWLLSNTSAPIVFLNGAEVQIDNSKEVGALHRHQLMNKALFDFVSQHKDRCYIVDVNKYVKSVDDLENNIRHYKRLVYIDLAKELIQYFRGDSSNISKFVIFKMMVKKVFVHFKRVIARLIWN